MDFGSVDMLFLSKKVDTRILEKFYFIMLRVITFLTTIFTLSSHGCSGESHILAEGQAQHLTEVSDSRARILKETLQPHDRCRCHLLRCAE